MLPSTLFTALPDSTSVFDSWDQLEEVWQHKCESSRQRWIFRGHRDEHWTFQSSLERAIWTHSVLHDKKPDRPADKTAAAREAYEKEVSDLQSQALAEGLPRYFQTPPSRITADKLEDGLIRRFQRQCHHYTSDTPKENATMEWLALMRHYGAPTRMIDWSWSFFVALFFGICRATSTSCVWGLNLDEAEKHIDPTVLDLIAKDQNARKRKTFQAVFTGSTPGVVNISPFRLNERLVIQQGTFLVPRNVQMSFDNNLASLLRAAAPSPLVKFRISGKRSVRRDLLQRLQRMNISMATLFPGLDGFAQSLEQLFAFPDVIVRRTPDKLNP